MQTQLLFKMFVVSTFMGLVLAELIFRSGDTAAYQSKISILCDYDLQYLYLSAWLFCRLVWFLNFFPTTVQQRIIRKDGSGELRSNMLIYQVAATQQLVLLAQGGDIGAYNSANRALGHFIENAPSTLLTLLLVSFVFPLPAFALTLLYIVGRLMHQQGYINHGHSGRKKGFYVISLASNVFEGLMLLTAIRAFV